MPTIIALDVSLSMQRFIPGRSEDNALTYHQLAVKGIAQLLEYLANNSKLEYIALVTYSTACEVKVDFTRDYDQVRQMLKKLEPADKLCLISMLKSVTAILSTNWGSTQNSCQIVAFTDCGLGFGSTALKAFLANYVGKEADTEYAWIGALKLFKLSFVCMGVHNDDYFIRALSIYQQLFDYTGLKGQLFVPKSPKDAIDATDSTPTENTKQQISSHKSELGRTAMYELMERVCEANFKPYETILRCGGYFRLECPIILWPPPVPQSVDGDDSSDGVTVRSLLPKLEVCGYLALSDIGSPASLSRHLITPKVEREKQQSRRDKASTSGINSKSATQSNSTQTKSVIDINNPNYEFEKLEQDIRDFFTKDSNNSKDNEESGGGGDDVVVVETINTKSSANVVPAEMQRESMCVLLHGALKVENMAALVLLNDNWYGFIYSYADSKKKSNLMLNILPPGNKVIPWLGDLNMLGFVEDIMPGETACTFPVKADKRSYSQNCVVWIKPASLQSDIQKVLRHAKKMPDKTQHFYKELNRIRRAALSIGFVELLEAMAVLFEREISHLSVNANPECSLQLQHAAMELRKLSNRDLKVSIVPLQKFNNTNSVVVGGGGGGGSADGSGASTTTGFIF